MTLLIDHFDSFTYNLKQMIENLNQSCQVIRSDSVDAPLIKKLKPDQIVLSPGPGHPNEQSGTLHLIREFAHQIPILGVCLGHQAMGLAFGAKIERTGHPKHGKTSFVKHKNLGIFFGLPSTLKVVRYHSLVVTESSLPPELEAIAHSEDGYVMALRHSTFPLTGLQFHPESIATECGQLLLQNFYLQSADFRRQK